MRTRALFSLAALIALALLTLVVSNVAPPRNEEDEALANANQPLIPALNAPSGGALSTGPSQDDPAQAGSGPVVAREVKHDKSPRLRDIKPILPPAPLTPHEMREPEEPHNQAARPPIE